MHGPLPGWGSDQSVLQGLIEPLPGGGPVNAPGESVSLKDLAYMGH